MCVTTGGIAAAGNDGCSGARQGGLRQTTPREWRQHAEIPDHTATGGALQYCELLPNQGLSQDLGTGCPKLAILKFWGVQICKGDHNIPRFQPYTCMNLSK